MCLQSGADIAFRNIKRFWVKIVKMSAFPHLENVICFLNKVTFCSHPSSTSLEGVWNHKTAVQYVRVMSVFVCVCGPVTGQSVIWHTRWERYERKWSIDRWKHPHKNCITLWDGMVRAVMLHPIGLDYSFSSVAHTHLHVYVITVILYSISHSYTIINAGVRTPWSGHCFGPLFHNVAQ